MGWWIVTTNYADCFAIYTYIESWCGKPEPIQCYMSIISQFLKIQDRLNYKNKLQSEHFPQSKYIDLIQL